MRSPSAAVVALLFAALWSAVAAGSANQAGKPTAGKSPYLLEALQPSALSPPLEEMKVRWDGKESNAGGMKGFDSPRFGLTRDGDARAHAGIDLDAPVGTPVFAVADGVVELARYGDAMYGSDVLLAFRPSPSILSYLARTGNADADGILFAHYAHLSAVFVETGQKVSRGTMIGRTGTSGNADQKYPHLHFEIRKIPWPGVGAEGLHNRVDPEMLFHVDFATPVEAITRTK